MSDSTVRNNPTEFSALLSDCTLCPRKCHADRLAGQTGYCGQAAAIKAARAALHFWEEPCISGTRGSGTVFFSGCNLRCVFCQNYNIANGNAGQVITPKRLTAIFLELQAQGAHNINLVTPTHYIPQIVQALQNAKKQGLDIPVVYNTSGYEEVSSLRLLDGLVDIYLPDLKYVSPDLSARYSHAPDYFEKASAALAEMFRQVGAPVFADDSKAGTSTGAKSGISESEREYLLKRGMIVRHLVLPGQTKDSKKVLRYLHETYGDAIYISIMNQYTPLPQVTHVSELNRRVTAEEYDRVLRFAERLNIQNGFIQEGEAAKDSFIPEFDCRGL
ncbi:MAG: radical SAM protein [Lachnospiraceae bacterium]|nr:radical SAM protein [Lachnospiraceae bacterium]MBR1852224.1 radical SAM protein [Lachnospiraceae bacterium]